MEGFKMAFELRMKQKLQVLW